MDEGQELFALVSYPNYKTATLLSNLCSSITLIEYHTLHLGELMAALASPISDHIPFRVNQSPDSVQVQSNIVQALLSPPPTIKKSLLNFSKSSPQDDDSQQESRAWRLSPFLLWEGTRCIRVRLFCILAIILAMLCWWRSGHIQDLEALKQRATDLTNKLLLPHVLDGSHFIPANNPNIHYVGRWSYTANRLRRDNSFPGAYLEFVVRNCTSAYVSLHDSDVSDMTHEVILHTTVTSEVSSLNFHPALKEVRRTAPVSLVSRIDHTDYNYFSGSGKGLVAIAAALEPSVDHKLRVIAAGIDGEGHRGMEFEGIWLSDGASLVTSQAEKEASQSQLVSEVPSRSINRPDQHSSQSLETGNAEMTESNGLKEVGFQHSLLNPQKTLEIVTDVPSIRRGPTHGRTRVARHSWQDLVGDMFGVDQVSIILNGMCVTSPCIGGSAQPASAKDAFFRSGPPGSAAFDRPWNFRSYVPDALVLMLGSSDETSFRKHTREYEKTIPDLRRQFEDAYLRLIRAIRRAAYPLHPAALHDYSSNADGFVYNSAPATIPIFVVSPFTGEMSQPSQKVVQRLQAEGDKAVFWLDTSGWFSSTDFAVDVDESVPDGETAYLSAEGNRKAAVFLHAHLCHYLADDPIQCPFLKHEAYTGNVYVPKDAELDKWIEESKVKKLKALFWPETQSDI